MLMNEGFAASYLAYLRDPNIEGKGRVVAGFAAQTATTLYVYFLPLITSHLVCIRRRHARCLTNTPMATLHSR